MKTDLELLREARALIEDEDHWCKEVLAQDAYGKEVTPTHEDACRWCFAGALNRVAGMNYPERGLVEVSPYERLYDKVKPIAVHLYQNDRGYGALTSVNDDHGHEAVMHVLDTVIAEEEKAHAA